MPVVGPLMGNGATPTKFLAKAIFSTGNSTGVGWSLLVGSPSPSGSGLVPFWLVSATGPDVFAPVPAPIATLLNGPARSLNAPQALILLTAIAHGNTFTT